MIASANGVNRDDCHQYGCWNKMLQGKWYYSDPDTQSFAEAFRTLAVHCKLFFR